MKTLRLPKAQPLPREAEVPTLVLMLSEPVPDVPVGPGWERQLRDRWNELGQEFVDALLAHAPGALVDSIFGHLALRKASLFHVRYERSR